LASKNLLQLYQTDRQDWIDNGPIA